MCFLMHPLKKKDYTGLMSVSSSPAPTGGDKEGNVSSESAGSSRRAPPAPICGLMSIATPLIGGLLLYMLWGSVDAGTREEIRQHQITHPGQGFSVDSGELYLGMSFRVLIPTPIIGIGFGVLARRRQERCWSLPIIGLFLNMVEIVFLIAHFVLVRYLSFVFW